MASPVAKRMEGRQESVRLACEGCDDLDICKGGCPYNAWAGGNGEQVKDPYCDAYRRTFGRITSRVLVEMATEENIEASRYPHSTKCARRWAVERARSVRSATAWACSWPLTRTGTSPPAG